MVRYYFGSDKRVGTRTPALTKNYIKMCRQVQKESAEVQYCLLWKVWWNFSVGQKDTIIAKLRTAHIFRSQGVLIEEYNLYKNSEHLEKLRAPNDIDLFKVSKDGPRG